MSRTMTDARSPRCDDGDVPHPDLKLVWDEEDVEGRRSGRAGDAKRAGARAWQAEQAKRDGGGRRRP